MELLLRAKRYLEGKKTYIVFTLLFGISLTNLLYGDVTFLNFLQDPNVTGFLSLLNDKDLAFALGSLGGIAHKAGQERSLSK